MPLAPRNNLFGVLIQGYLEIFREGAWRFPGELIHNRFYSPGESPEPEWLPEPLFCSERKELVAILGKLARMNPAYNQAVDARGLPPDVSPEVRGWLGFQLEAPAFYVTWYTVRELTEFDWVTGGGPIPWGEPYARIAHNLWAEIQPQLQAAGPPDEVRLIISLDL